LDPLNQKWEQSSDQQMMKPLVVSELEQKLATQKPALVLEEFQIIFSEFPLFVEKLVCPSTVVGTLELCLWVSDPQQLVL